MLLSALVGVSLYVLITYDIACQYFKAFWTRIRGLPARLRPTFDHNKLTVKVPKGHIRAHDDSCYGPYSLNYTEGAGETDGARPARGRRAKGMDSFDSDGRAGAKASLNRAQPEGDRDIGGDSLY